MKTIMLVLRGEKLFRIWRRPRATIATPNSTLERNVETGEVRQLKQTEILGGFDAKNYRSERRWVTARDGVKLHGYLTMPAGVPPQNLPLVVNPHGGPHGPREQRGRDAQQACDRRPGQPRHRDHQRHRQQEVSDEQREQDADDGQNNQ